METIFIDDLNLISWKALESDSFYVATNKNFSHISRKNVRASQR